MLKLCKLKCYSHECGLKPTSCEPPLLDLMPTSDRAGVNNMDTSDGGAGGFHSQDFKIGMSTGSSVVEAVVRIC